MLLAQLSDLHIVPPGERLSGRVDTPGRLAQVVAAVAALDPRPQAVVLTGDLTDRGDDASYRHLRTLLAPLTMPVYVIPGNHDSREPLRAAFSDRAWMPRTAGSPIRFAVELGALRLVALDTLVEGRDHGTVGGEQLEWLDAELARVPDRPTLVAVHHPPVNSGVRVMDGMRLTDAEQFGTVIARHPHVERVLCGHLHRTMHVRWRGSVVSACPSTSEQLLLSLGQRGRLGSVAEPPAYQVHWWDAADGLITHTVTVGDFAGPFLYV